MKIFLSLLKLFFSNYEYSMGKPWNHGGIFFFIIKPADFYFITWVNLKRQTNLSVYLIESAFITSKTFHFFHSWILNQKTNCKWTHSNWIAKYASCSFIITIKPSSFFFDNRASFFLHRKMLRLGYERKKSFEDKWRWKKSSSQIKLLYVFILSSFDATWEG